MTGPDRAVQDVPARDLPPRRREVLIGAGLAGATVATLAACGAGEKTPSKPTTSATFSAGDVPVGGGAIDKGAGLVVTQPTAGQYKAFSAKCTHQGCTVSEVKDGKIYCPCHSSYFSADNGEPVAGPAKQALPVVAVTQEGSTLVVGG